VSNEPQEQKCLDFNLAREIQRDIEELPGAWCSHLVSLAERKPTAYRVELYLGGLGGEDAAAFQRIAEAHGVEARATPVPDGHPARGLRVVFDRSRRRSS
jgi:hypothetical protein